MSEKEVWNFEFSFKGVRDPTFCRYMLVLIAHAQMPLINAHTSVAITGLHSSENRVDPNQLISICKNMFIPYQSISLHMDAHAALASFFSFLFLNFTFFKKYFSDIRYTICLDPINIPYFVVPNLGPF